MENKEEIEIPQEFFIELEALFQKYQVMFYQFNDEYWYAKTNKTPFISNVIKDDLWNENGFWIDWQES